MSGEDTALEDEFAVLFGEVVGEVEFGGGAVGALELSAEVMAGAELLAEVVDDDGVSGLELVEFVSGGEAEGEDAEVDEVGGVDALDAEGDDAADAEIERADGGVFAAGALSVAFGGGDDPEDGLEALAYAIRSKWNTEGLKKRQLIVVWSDAPAHELGFGKSAENYPKKMAKDFNELTQWWGDKDNTGYTCADCR